MLRPPWSEWKSPTTTTISVYNSFSGNCDNRDYIPARNSPKQAYVNPDSTAAEPIGCAH